MGNLTIRFQGLHALATDDLANPSNASILMPSIPRPKRVDSLAQGAKVVDGHTTALLYSADPIDGNMGEEWLERTHDLEITKLGAPGFSKRLVLLDAESVSLHQPSDPLPPITTDSRTFDTEVPANEDEARSLHWLPTAREFLGRSSPAKSEIDAIPSSTSPISCRFALTNGRLESGAVTHKLIDSGSTVYLPWAWLDPNQPTQTSKKCMTTELKLTLEDLAGTVHFLFRDYEGLKRYIAFDTSTQNVEVEIVNLELHKILGQDLRLPPAVNKQPDFDVDMAAYYDLLREVPTYRPVPWHYIDRDEGATNGPCKPILLDGFA